MKQETQTLGEVLKSFDSTRVPIKSSERLPGKTPYLGASGVVDHVDGFTHEGSYLCVSEDGANLLTRSLPIAWVQEGQFWANNHLHVLGGVSRDHLKFFQYAIEQTNIAAYISGSAQPKLTQQALSTVRVPRFGAEGETAIGKLLAALDDKIAANNRVLDAADRLVRESFRVLRKDGEMTLGDVCTQNRAAVSPDSFPNTGIYVGLEHFDSRKIWVSRHGSISDVTSTKSVFQSGDTLFGKLRPYFHKVGVAPSGGICSTDILVLRAARPEWRNFVLAAASSDEVVEAAVQNSNGTRMPRAKWTDIAGCAIPDPTTAESCRFIELVDALVPKCIGLMNENEALARTRDELLPLLMSGKISVAGASRSGVGAEVEGLLEGKS
ncbi:restriction endonuclease subunit S [Corynebacterium vitaeruminis]|uniref:restriction endonuclease subunit S n=1 Tax=Corynebacterium vitaeruminis TaxID=38305 RepID=UPI0023F5316C|nr:restriction endonuclease subunit S [Corynebacterium vitaeruminis]